VKTAASFLKRLRTAEQAVCVVAFVVMAVMLIADVAMREVLGVGWYGASQRAVLAMVVVVFFALGLATADGVHLRPRFADALIPQRWESFMLRVADLITALFYLTVAVVAVFVTAQTFGLNERTPTLRWEVWPFQAVMIVAFGLSGLRHIIYLIYPALRPSDSSSERPGITPVDAARAAQNRADEL
jgi:TRAP-type C4-dicarboxylate transport system permease small subunit